MIIATLYGYEVHQPTSGGKAGKHCNVTSTIQVRQGSQIVKSFRYTVDKPGSSRNAIKKARQFIISQRFPSAMCE